jgi:aspartate racemase
MTDKVAGILGGMGPEATVDLMARVIRATPASDDCDHVRLVVDNNPQVPSRIKALIEKAGDDPTPCLQEMARKLEGWGVDFLAMPCNTAHCYHGQIQAAVAIPVLNMITLAAETLTSCQPRLQAIGILASTAVLDLGLYDLALAEKNIRLISPDEGLQADLMRAIRTIKTGRQADWEEQVMQAAADNLADKGAEALLVACTELSIVAEGLETDMPCYDTAQILAEAIVRKAKG